jgi:pimeloyl-ACP methyl ester carboxylesterase
LALDLTTKVTRLEIHVYFFSGAYDLTVNHDLAKSYLAGLKAPVKGFYTFENSAHSPNFEEPEKMLLIIQKDVMPATNGLADKDLL